MPTLNCSTEHTDLRHFTPRRLRSALAAIRGWEPGSLTVLSEYPRLILKGHLCALTYLIAPEKGRFRKQNYRNRVMGKQ